MEITKLSSKGQVVIPERVRDGIGVGTAFAVSRKNNLIILKKWTVSQRRKQESSRKSRKSGKKSMRAQLKATHLKSSLKNSIHGKDYSEQCVQEERQTP